MRQIIKDIKKVDELFNQFINNDNFTLKEVNNFIPDSYIIKEAKHHLEISINELQGGINGTNCLNDFDTKRVDKDIKQLKSFIYKWSKKITKHKNDGMNWKELQTIIRSYNNDKKR